MHHRFTGRIIATLVIAWIALGPAPSAAQSRGLMPADFYSEVGVGDVAISPDGALVAFTVTTVNEEENRRHREVLVARAAGRAAGRRSVPVHRPDPRGERAAMVARQPDTELPVAPGRRRRHRGDLVRPGDLPRW